MVQFGKPVFVVQEGKPDTGKIVSNPYVIDFNAILKEMEISKMLSPYAETHEITQGTFEYYDSVTHGIVKREGYRVASKEHDDAKYYDRETMSLWAADQYETLPEILPAILVSALWGVKWTHHHVPSPYVPQDPPANVVQLHEYGARQKAA